MSLIAVGITGGIGAYKSVEIVRELQQHGHEVVAVMTESATKFIGPLTLEAITRHRVITDQYESGANADIEHIALASKIDLLVVAPATANIIGKFANGIADDFLSGLFLATRAPVLIAPAMNTNMLTNQAVQNNLATLRSRGVRFVEPGEGYLACGWIGKGRLAEPESVVQLAEQTLTPDGALAGLCILVTAGPTYEDIDPVRYIGNRSSGRMGYALVDEALSRGARVILVSGPSALEAPSEAEVHHVRNAKEMHEVVMERVVDADVVVMAAAVADYEPTNGRFPQKIAKHEELLSLTLRRTVDILGEVGRYRGNADRPIIIGFAAETADLETRARKKLKDKNMDLIVVNDVSRSDIGFDTETNEGKILGRENNTCHDVPLVSKRVFASNILTQLERLLQSKKKLPAT